MKKIIPIILATTLIGCSSSPQEEQNAVANDNISGDFPDTISNYIAMLGSNPHSASQRSVLTSVHAGVTKQQRYEQGIRIADSYMQFGSTKSHYDTARKWYEFLAEKGVTEANLKLSEYHIIPFSPHIELNLEEATKWRDTYYDKAQDFVLANDIQTRIANLSVIELAKLGVNVQVGDVHYTQENAAAHEILTHFFFNGAEEERISRYDSSVEKYAGNWVIQKTSSAEICERVSSVSLPLLKQASLVNIDIKDKNLNISSIVSEDDGSNEPSIDMLVQKPFGPTVLVGHSALSEDLGTARYYLMTEFQTNQIQIFVNPILLTKGWPFAIEQPDYNDLLGCGLTLKRTLDKTTAPDPELTKAYTCATQGDISCQNELGLMYLRPSKGKADVIKGVIWQTVAQSVSTGTPVKDFRLMTADADPGAAMALDYAFTQAEKCIDSNYDDCPAL